VSASTESKSIASVLLESKSTIVFDNKEKNMLFIFLSCLRDPIFIKHGQKLQVLYLSFIIPEIQFLPVTNFFKSLCETIAKSDKNIRFAAIVDHHGTIMAYSERKGIKPLLNEEQTAQYALAAVTRQYTRIRWQSILGKIDYTCSSYEKLLRITIPITDSRNHLCFVIIFTLDVATKNFHQIIMNKVKPIVKEKEKELLNRA
jgi:hypothetical protein